MSRQTIEGIVDRLRGIKRLCNHIRGGVGNCSDCEKNESFVVELLRAMNQR